VSKRRIGGATHLALVLTALIVGCTGERPTLQPPSTTLPARGSAATLLATASTSGGSTRPTGSSTPAAESTLLPVEATVPPPAAGVEELSPGLLSALEMGVPDTWAALDFEPALVDDPALAGDIDPFRDLVTCSEGTLRDDTAPWIARRFSATDAPMDNGLLSVELILESESAGDHAGDLGRLARCTAVEAATLKSSTAMLEVPTVPARTVEATRWQVTTEGTDDTPFAYAFQAVWAHDGDATVGVILGGQPATNDWPEAADRLAGRALAALAAAQS